MRVLPTSALDLELTLTLTLTPNPNQEDDEEDEEDDDEAPPDARELDLWLIESQVPGCTRAAAEYAYDQVGEDVARALPLADDLCFLDPLAPAP